MSARDRARGQTSRSRTQRSQRTVSRGAQRGVSGKTTYATPNRSNKIQEKIKTDRENKKEQKEIRLSKAVQDRKQLAQTLKQAGAVTSGAFSGNALWSKSPVIYSERDPKTGRFDPESERIGQVDLSKTQVDGLTPFYSTLHPGAFHTGNAAYEARMKVLADGGTEEEAQAAADAVNEELNKAFYVDGIVPKMSDDRGAITTGKDRRDLIDPHTGKIGDYEGIESLVKDDKGYYTGSIDNEYGMLGGYLGRDPHTGKMYPIKDPVPGILSRQSSGSSGGGGGWGGGYGGGGGGGDGYGFSGFGQDQMPQGYQRGQVGPGSLQEQVNQMYLGMSGVGMQKKRGGIVSLLRLR